MTEDAPSTYPSGIPRPEFVLPGEDSEILILTGMSGAGRTRAAAALADLGWYVVDNLPPQMLAGLMTMVAREERRRVAAVVDARGGDLFRDLDAVLDHLIDSGATVRLVFLDANDDALVRRFEEGRRPHPLQRDGTLLEGIARERELLRSVRARADHVIDTSELNVHELRDVIGSDVADETPRLQLNVVSFGFKNGTPHDAEYVADVRFLHNPHWVPELRPLTGLDDPVRDHVLGSEGAREFVESFAAMLDSALHLYRAQDKHSVTIAMGCTGGRHRSVAMSEALGQRLREAGYEVRVTHRDKDR